MKWRAYYGLTLSKYLLANWEEKKKNLVYFIYRVLHLVAQNKAWSQSLNRGSFYPPDKAKTVAPKIISRAKYVTPCLFLPPVS